MFYFCKFFIFLDCVIFSLSVDINGLFINNFGLKVNSDGIYYITGNIGTPEQRVSLKISFFSSNYTISCSNNEILENEIDNYNPNISSTSYFMTNITLTNKSENNPQIYLDVLTINDNYFIENFSLICDNNSDSNQIGIIAIMSDIFYLENYPYLYICLHKNGGFISQSNITINDGYLEAAQIKTTDLLFMQSNYDQDFKLVVTNVGIKNSDVINFMDNLSEFNVSIDGTNNYHELSPDLFQKIVNFLYQGYFNRFESFLNDDSCYFIKSFEDIKNIMPTLVFMLGNSELLEFRLSDYLLFYPDQELYCYNFRQNINNNLNILSISLFKNRLIQTDFAEKTAKLIDVDCEKSDLNDILNPNFDINGGTLNINEIFINVFIAFSCLLIFLLGLYSFVKIKEFLLRRQTENESHINLIEKKKNKKNKLEMDQVKIQIIEKNKKQKNNDKSSKYLEKEEEKKEAPSGEKEKKENAQSFKILQDFEKIEKTKIKENFLKNNKNKEKSRKTEKSKKKGHKKYFSLHFFLLFTKFFFRSAKKKFLDFLEHTKKSH